VGPAVSRSPVPAPRISVAAQEMVKVNLMRGGNYVQCLRRGMTSSFVKKKGPVFGGGKNRSFSHEDKAGKPDNSRKCLKAGRDAPTTWPSHHGGGEKTNGSVECDTQPPLGMRWTEPPVPAKTSRSRPGLVMNDGHAASWVGR